MLDRGLCQRTGSQTVSPIRVAIASLGRLHAADTYANIVRVSTRYNKNRLTVPR